MFVNNVHFNYSSDTLGLMLYYYTNQEVLCSVKINTHCMT